MIAEYGARSRGFMAGSPGWSGRSSIDEGDDASEAAANFADDEPYGIR
jgi:hypothetical protein